MSLLVHRLFVFSAHILTRVLPLPARLFPSPHTGMINIRNALENAKAQLRLSQRCVAHLSCRLMTDYFTLLV
jgi:hypothetical protein